jgi:hypothetical protein
MSTVQIQSWRRPITAHAEETYDLESGEPKRSINWHLHGANQHDDAERLAKGMACGVCLSVFPARPCLENMRDFKPIAHEWEPMRTKDDVMRMVAQGVCPTCASEVSDRMHEIMHRGLDPLRPKGMDE